MLKKAIDRKKKCPESEVHALPRMGPTRPVGARFAFNCYRHSAQLVVRCGVDTDCALLLS